MVRPHRKLEPRSMNAGFQPTGAKRRRQWGKRARGTQASDQPFVPPEDWYEPNEEDERRDGYRVVVQPAGKGYLHVVNEQDVRSRLAQLPSWMTEPLEVVQLSCMTRKKKTLPCYGMQWGQALYLYPIEQSLIEYFSGPPPSALRTETMMHGGRWTQRGHSWELTWTEDTIRDFYLNNVLIHELGHLLDDRNRSYIDRERYAEWFALEYGYKPSRRKKLAKQAASRMVRRRHHST